MTNWIITQTPRFKAAVSAASVSNLVSFYSTSLYQDLIHTEFGGFPWDNYDLLWQWSPLRYVKQAQTPTMFIHGEQDEVVPFRLGKKLYELAPPPKDFYSIPGAMHNALPWVAGPEYTTRIREFLKSLW